MAEKKTQVTKQMTTASRTRFNLECFSKVTVSLIFLMAGCAPVETNVAATQILPPPVIQITPAAANTAVPAEPVLPPTAPAKIPIPKSDIAQLADDLYGTRMIEQISIPALNVESKVVPVGWRINFADELQDSEFEWDSPEANIGWIITSSLPDETGNVIFYGHNNIYEKIFEHLSDLTEGDKVELQTGNQNWEYEVRNIMLLPVTGASREQLKSYQQYLQPTQDARITLISCWPPISNTHRVVVIAHRVSNP